MKTKILMAVLVSFLVISVVAVTTSIAANDKAKEEPKGPGDNAKAPDLEKIEFIHWRKGFGRGNPCNNDGVCDPDENPSCADCKNGEEEPPAPTCYAFMGKYGKKYLKWPELPVDYVINPTDSGLDESDVALAIFTGAEEWDSWMGSELFDNDFGVDDEVEYRVQDYTNAICFDDYYSDPDIIGACTVWYNPATKTIVEFDIVFETDYTWAIGAGETEMDVQNIATHELGHAVGLADVYDEGCSDVTMYGYSVEGETKKTTLEEPDVTGILILYE